MTVDRAGAAVRDKPARRAGGKGDSDRVVIEHAALRMVVGLLS